MENCINQTLTTGLVVNPFISVSVLHLFLSSCPIHQNLPFLHVCIYTERERERERESFQTFFVWALLLIVHT